MASTASSEASEIRRRGRQRLIGAVALVVLLVVFVPMMLDSEPRAPQPQPGIPSRDNAPSLPPPAPAKVATAPAASPAPAFTPAEAAAQSPAVARTEPIESKQLGSTPPKPPAAAPPPAPKAAPKLEGFAVQVGAFRDEAKLKQAREKLATAGITHYTERLDAQGGPLTRLRAGPYPTREAAEAAQAQLKRAALDGKVVPLP